MKQTLPHHHGLSEKILQKSELVPRFDEAVSITDIQFGALEAGVARGQSLIVSAPTSTGKTLIGWWAIASAIEQGKRAVYLVSHRALAKQKFEEVQKIFLKDFLDNDRSSIVCATGDGVEDCAGRRTSNPAAATILIATYEKYLSVLSVGGPPTDLTETCFVCDELQLVGDKHRGHNTELLLTLMRRAGWFQLVALSAVLSEKDASSLGGWLNTYVLRNPSREKSITLECRTGTATYAVSYGPTYEGDETVGKAKVAQQLNEIVLELSKDKQRSPIIVFCMTVDETYNLSRAWALTQPEVADGHLVVPSDELDDNLHSLIKRKAAYHNAELTEEERAFIEECIQSEAIEVVFATSTLAAGVNFPLGSAVFASWERYNFSSRAKEPIPATEFQNMAGRVGRMGQEASEGLVILMAEDGRKAMAARNLMNLKTEGALGNGIDPEDFGTLTLQLFAGRLCSSKEDAFQLIGSTLTASREVDRNRAGISHWRNELYDHIDRLIACGCLIQTGPQIVVTTFGTAVAQSGLKPETALFFLEGLASNGQDLVAQLDGDEAAGRETDLLFILAHAALASPEFSEIGGKASRGINWRIGKDGAVSNSYARRLTANLFVENWSALGAAANGAMLVADWAAGDSRQQLQKLVKGVRLGTIQSTAREIAWILTGISEIIQQVTSPTLAEESRPERLRGRPTVVEKVRQLARPMRRQAVRIGFGLPSDVLWMTDLVLQGPKRRLTRTQVLKLRSVGLTRPIDLMDGGPINDERRRQALGAGGSNNLANLARNAALTWKSSNREHCKSIHLRRSEKLGISEVVQSLYQSRGDEFEVAFEASLSNVAISFEKLDNKMKQGRPDYLLLIESFEPIVVELKSRQNDTDLVSLNSVTEVLAASELAGYKSNFCVTLCNPGVEPSVPSTIEACGRLAALEVTDFVEAFVRLREGTLTRQELHNWLTTPGIALGESLPYTGSGGASIRPDQNCGNDDVL